MFILEIVRISSYVIKAPPPNNVSTGYFLIQNIQNMYIPFYVCPFQPQLVFGLSISKQCVKITYEINNLVVHVSVMHN